MGEFVAVDWGSTRLRLRLLEDAGEGPAAEVERPEGIGAVPRERQADVFLNALDALLAGAGRASARTWAGEVWFSGMVTSTLGWMPTPYVRAPAGAGDIVANRRIEGDGLLVLHFLPGVRTEDDILRGEEVEAIGIFGREGAAPPGGRAILVLPGTHSKWIRWEDGRIAGFITAPTGDVHAAIHRAALVGRTLPPEPATVTGELLDAFDRGADLARRDGPLASIFKARSLAVLEDLPPAAASALLSGALIAGEALERTKGDAPAPIVVGGAPALAALYLRALARLGIAASGIPPRVSALASAEGMRVLRRIASPR